jgi:hypothetical protein
VAADRPRSRTIALALVWLVAVPVAAGLGVLGLRAAGGDQGGMVISAAGADALATQAAATPNDLAGPTTRTSRATPTATPRPTVVPSPSASPTAPPPVASPPATPTVVERRVPGAVLGLRCEQAVPLLAWAVPDAGWRVEETETENGRLVVVLEGGGGESRVTVVCRDGVPTVVQAERRDD